ncbi:MAG: hypothetical protein J6A72_00455 [Alistipes sp.]|nr:hypothetical protein [Alistipes sp.]
MSRELQRPSSEVSEISWFVHTTAKTKQQWREASEQHPITWHNWSDGKRGTGIYAHYEHSGIPNYVLISPEGIVIDQWVGYGSGSLKLKIAEHLHK